MIRLQERFMFLASGLPMMLERAINPQGIEGQIEGGAVQSIGQAIMENFVLYEGACNRELCKIFRLTSGCADVLHQSG